MTGTMKWTAVLAGVALAGAAPTAGQETVRLSGDRVSVYNLAGEVDVVAGGGSDVVVTVNLGGREAGRLSLDRTRIDGREALVVVYPGDEVVYQAMGRNSRTNLRVRDDGTFGHGRGGRRVTIRGSGDGLRAHADLRIEVPRGRDLAVYTAVGETRVRGTSGRLLVDMGSGPVEVEGVSGLLEVDTGSGSVRVSDVDGDVSIDTGSGGVTVRDVRGQELIVDTGSGSVRGSNLSASIVEIDTGSGSVNLERVTSPDVEVDTGSGSVELDLTTDVDRLVVDTGSGGVTVRFAEDVGAEVEVETGSGGISVDFPIELRVTRRDHIVGRVGDGRGRIHIDTGSGGVRLLRR